MRAPDVAFVAASAPTRTGMPKGYWPGPPDLAIEVVSQHDRRTKVEAKALDWIAAGTRAVVVARSAQPHGHRLPRRSTTSASCTRRARSTSATSCPAGRPRVADLFV